MCLLSREVSGGCFYVVVNPLRAPPGGLRRGSEDSPEARLAKAVRSARVAGQDMSYVIFLVTGITGEWGRWRYRSHTQFFTHFATLHNEIGIVDGMSSLIMLGNFRVCSTRPLSSAVFIRPDGCLE